MCICDLYSGGLFVKDKPYSQLFTYVSSLGRTFKCIEHWYLHVICIVMVCLSLSTYLKFKLFIYLSSLGRISD